MKIIKKIDSVGRIAVPVDIRRSLRWMEGDEIEVIHNDDNTITLRKHEDDTLDILHTLRDRCEDEEIETIFDYLITEIEAKTE